MHLTWPKQLLPQRRDGHRRPSHRTFWLRLMLPAVLLLLAGNVFTTTHGIGFSSLVIDPLEYAHLPSYIGCLSVLGCLLWIASATVCLGTAFLVRSASQFPRAKLRYIQYLGVLLLVLTLDDTYRLHESFKGMVAFNEFLQSIHKNWFEGAFYLAYAVFGSWILIRCRRAIAQTDLYLLGVFVGCILLSTLADLLMPGDFRFYYQVEEGLKFLAIVSMMAYCLDLSRRSLTLWRTLGQVPGAAL